MSTQGYLFIDSNHLLNLKGNSSDMHQHILLKYTPQIPKVIFTGLCLIWASFSRPGFHCPPAWQYDQAIGYCPSVSKNTNIDFTTVQFFYYTKKEACALAGVAQWIEHRLWTKESLVLIPSQGTLLGCEPEPQWEPGDRQPHIDVSVPLFLPPFLSL